MDVECVRYFHCSRPVTFIVPKSSENFIATSRYKRAVILKTNLPTQQEGKTSLNLH